MNLIRFILNYNEYKIYIYIFFIFYLSQVDVAADVVGVYMSPRDGLCVRHVTHVCVRIYTRH